jgi:hypothetical protein
MSSTNGNVSNVSNVIDNCKINGTTAKNNKVFNGFYSGKDSNSNYKFYYQGKLDKNRQYVTVTCNLRRPLG